MKKDKKKVFIHEDIGYVTYIIPSCSETHGSTIKIGSVHPIVPLVFRNTWLNNTRSVHIEWYDTNPHFFESCLLTMLSPSSWCEMGRYIGRYLDIYLDICLGFLTSSSSTWSCSPLLEFGLCFHIWIWSPRSEHSYLCFFFLNTEEVECLHNNVDMSGFVQQLYIMCFRTV